MGDDVYFNAPRRRHRRQRPLIVDRLLEADVSSYCRRRPSTDDTGYSVTDMTTDFHSTSLDLDTGVFSRSGHGTAASKREHVPAVVKCECNGLETYAMIDTSVPVSTVSEKFLERLRMSRFIVPLSNSVTSPLSSRQIEAIGKVEGLGLALGNWQQLAPFHVVGEQLLDVILGGDFLRETQSVINFEDSSLYIGGATGARIPFLSCQEIVNLSRKLVRCKDHMNSVFLPF